MLDPAASAGSSPIVLIVFISHLSDYLKPHAISKPISTAFTEWVSEPIDI